MDKGGILFFLIIIIGIFYIIYDSIPSKYTKLEENFGGFMNRSLVRFEYENSQYILLFMVELVQGKHILLGIT